MGSYYKDHNLSILSTVPLKDLYNKTNRYGRVIELHGYFTIHTKIVEIGHVSLLILIMCFNAAV